MTYLIRFDFPEGSMYAGLYKGALGWAPTPATALEFETEDAAGRMLANGYGPLVEFGFIVDYDAEAVA